MEGVVPARTGLMEVQVEGSPLLLSMAAHDRPEISPEVGAARNQADHLVRCLGHRGCRDLLV